MDLTTYRIVNLVTLDPSAYMKQVSLVHNVKKKFINDIECTHTILSKAVDKKLKLSSISSFRWKHETEVISFKQWNIYGNYDSVTSCRQQTVTNVPIFLNAAVADAFGKVVMLGATELHTLYTTVAQVSKREYEDSTVSHH